MLLRIEDDIFISRNKEYRHCIRCFDIHYQSKYTIQKSHRIPPYKQIDPLKINKYNKFEIAIKKSVLRAPILRP